MRRITGTEVVTLLAALLFATAAIAQSDPLLGTWVLNVAKSQGPPGTLPDSATVVVSDAGGGKYRAVSDTSMTGIAIHAEVTFAMDGSDVTPVVTPEMPGGMSVTQSAERLGPGSYKSTVKMNGAVVATATNEVSADGKTLTVVSTGQGIAAGASSTTIFDRK
jgi:hypothetical protein